MWFLVAALSSVAVLACLIALVGQVRRLGRAARRLSDELGPLLEETERAGRRAAERGRRAEARGRRR